MASSDSRRNNVGQVVDEDDEEEEYEEIEVEEEIEEEEEPEEDEEEEPEEDEEVEEEVEEEEEEEEYEEVEIEVEEEVTDEEEEEEDATMAEEEVKGGDNGVVKSNDLALVAANYESPLPVVADNQDGSLDVNSKDVACLRTQNTSTIKSEARSVTETRASETLCLGGGSSSRESQNKDEKSKDDVSLKPRHSSAIKPEPSILTGALDSKSLLHEIQNGDGTEISSFVGSSVSTKLIEQIPGPSNGGTDSVKDNEPNEDLTILASTSEKNASGRDDLTEQLTRIIDAEVSKPLADVADLHSSPSQSKGKEESRSCLPQVRPRSLLPKGECEDSSKRPAISCHYFAKGWCIKGSSCRFLHKSDHTNVREVEEDKLKPTVSGLHHEKGSGHDANASELVNEKSKSTEVKDRRKKNREKSKSRRREDNHNMPLLEQKTSLSIDSPKSSYKDHTRSISTPREVEADIFNDNHSLDGHNLPNLRLGSLSRDFGVSPGSDSILRLVEESAALRRRYSMDIQNSMPSYHIYKGTSLRHNSSFLTNYKTQLTPYNWEPSLPFRSSFIPPVNRPSNAQYDPFRDSIEDPVSGRSSFKHLSYGQTQNVQSLSGQNPSDFQQRLSIDNNWDNKSSSGNDKSAPAYGSESAANSGNDAQNRSIVEEENPVVPGSVKDILKANKGNEGNFKLSSGLKGEKGRQTNELDEEESRAIRSFRVALIEFVKELMKPIWHEGRLSKDVYKVIVQKAEDKILSTLQPSQVPNTSESVQQYLSSSQLKILKLIQAYVDKYGRF